MQKTPQAHLCSAEEVSGGFMSGFRSNSRPRAAALTETMTEGCCFWEEVEEERSGVWPPRWWWWWW